jgi:glycosyltransferase involved in cell wall biosynthesis
MEKEKNRYHHLSAGLRGDILATTWWNDRKERKENIAKTAEACGRFGYHAIPYYRGRLEIMRPLFVAGFFVAKGAWLSMTRGSYDAVVAYGPFTTGVSAVLLKWLTKTKCIIEVPGNFMKTNTFLDGPQTLEVRIKSTLGPALAKLILNRSDHLKVLYPPETGSQVLRKPYSVFHNLVGISQIKPGSMIRRDPVILLIGHPWHLKGVDILIRAFNRICGEFPKHRLKIVGWCADKSPFEKLKGNNDRIELLDPIPNPEAMILLAKSELFVLPSRTEGMGRVLLEAMAAKTPIIASRVDGIPHYVDDGKTGILVDSENVDQLAEAMRRLLADKPGARAMAESAYETVFQKYSEERFTCHFFRMIDEVVSNSRFGKKMLHGASKTWQKPRKGAT